MSDKVSKKISLGFTSEKFEPGVHICQIYSSDDERHQALIDFVISGLEGEENTACFTEKETEESILEHIKNKGIDLEEVKDKGCFSISDTKSVYFQDNKFSPDRMLGLLKDFYSSSMEKGCCGARVIGEMTEEIEHVQDGSRLLEYESKVSMLLRDHPVNAVCQYDATKFSGSTIMEILKVHPYMIVRGKVVRNPYYVTPEEYLESIK